MTERNGGRNEGEADASPAGGDESVIETADATPSAGVRDVIGRRGYDEGEDETASEDEEH